MEAQTSPRRVAEAPTKALWCLIPATEALTTEALTRTRADGYVRCDRCSRTPRASRSVGCVVAAPCNLQAGAETDDISEVCPGRAYACQDSDLERGTALTTLGEGRSFR